MKSRAVVIGIILGLAVSGRKVIDAFRKSGSPVRQLGAGATTQESPKHAPGMPNVASGADTAGSGWQQESGVEDKQHGDLGGVPPMEDADSLLMGGSAASDDAGSLAGASAYSSESGPYDADISEEGVTLTYDDPTDREGDVPLDEGIPNLGEPGDVDDAGPETLAAEATIDEVESGVPEEFGEEEPIDSVEHEDAWVADAPGEENEIPAASRGLREYGEGDEDEEDIEDTDDTGSFDLDEEAEPSGAGGEVDLENDEAPQGENEGFEIVDDPNDPLSADAGGTMVDPLVPEETLGLRDSESSNAPNDQDNGETRSNLGMTGDFDEAVTTQRFAASTGEADTAGDSGSERQASFATGDRAHEGVDDTGVDRDTGDQKKFGQTGEFGVPAPEEVGPNIETGESDQNVGSTGEPTDVSEEQDTEEAGTGPDRSEKPEDDGHLGVSGDFDKAEDTEKIPAEPAGEDNADSDKSGAGYSAAWSTPAGVVGEWPNQEEGAKGFPRERADDEQQAREVASDTSDSADGKSAGESGQITSEAGARADMESTSATESGMSASDLSGGDAADLAASAAGDLGAATVPAGSSEPQGDRRFPTDPTSGGAEDGASSNAPEDKQTSPRKSRKQRRMEAMDWVPAGAVKGDGSPNCPVDYPIKGNANSRIYHRPHDPSYANTIPEYCFSTEENAKQAGFRAPKG